MESKLTRTQKEVLKFLDGCIENGSLVKIQKYYMDRVLEVGDFYGMEIGVSWRGKIKSYEVALDEDDFGYLSIKINDGDEYLTVFDDDKFEYLDNKNTLETFDDDFGLLSLRML